MENMYSRGKIYKLVNDIDDEIYVGSTCSPLYVRLAGHKMTSYCTPKRQVYAHVLKIGWENVDIVLIEEFPCDSKMQLHKRERYWIEELKPSLNKSIPTRTAAEYRKEHKEERRAGKKKYRENNREKVLADKKKYRENNREKVLADKKKYRENNREMILEKKRQYRDENKEAINAQKRQKYADKKNERILEDI